MPQELEPSRHTDVDQWSDAQSRALLDFVASSAEAMTGFRDGVVNVLMGDWLTSVAIAGEDTAVEAMRGLAIPAAPLVELLESGQRLGRYSFVPHERGSAFVEAWGHPSSGDDESTSGWHSNDTLTALLFDDDGALIGTIGVDDPVNGQRPDDTQVRLLDRYAELAEQTLRTALERERTARTLRLARAARELLGSATTSITQTERLPDAIWGLLQDAFEADALDVYLDARWRDAMGPGRDGRLRVTSASRIRDLRAIASDAWRDQRVVPVTDSVEATVLVPVGAGSVHLGFFAVTHRRPGTWWSPEVERVAMEIGRDVGSSLVQVTEATRERELAAELRRMSSYKSELLATVSHELKNPAAVLLGHAEVIRDWTEPDDEAVLHDLDQLVAHTGRIEAIAQQMLSLAAAEASARRASAREGSEVEQ